MARLRAEIDEATGITADQESFNVNELCNKPLIQSAYAETLRLRIGIVIARTPEFEPFHLGRWLIPKDMMMLLFSRTAALNKDVWSTGGDGDPHPLEEFWAERFLVYPDKPDSGPLRKPRSAVRQQQQQQQQQEQQQQQPQLYQEQEGAAPAGPRFSMSGLSGAWIPYGGGQRMCPGRHFAKQEIITTFAMLMSKYEIELLPAVRPPKPDMRFYPLGGLPPDTNVPVRIRRRR